MAATTATAELDAVLSGAVARGDMPLVVALAAGDDGVLYEGAAGVAGPDSTFRVASMAKIVTTVAALQLVERGQLDLAAPVAAYVPRFADIPVLDGFDGETPRLRPPASPVTVAQLDTHTSGLAYGFFDPAIARWQERFQETSFGDPLVADPGTRFTYGTSTDWLGRVVAAAAGQRLTAYLAEHVFGPLGMERTTFALSDAQADTLVGLHIRGADGAWTTDVGPEDAPRWLVANPGLYSTPRDFLRLQRMLLAGGTLDGVRLLAPETVAAAFANQIGALDVPALVRTTDRRVASDFTIGRGHKWGHGLLLNTTRAAGMRAAFSGGWAGIFNTFFWVDPASRVTGALYTQTLPFIEPGARRVWADFERALYAAI